MGAEDMGKSALQSLTGGICKAIIEICDERKNAKDVTVSTVTAKKTGSLSTGVSAGAVNKAAQGAVGKSLQEGLKDLTSSLPQGKESKKRFEVQFNPSQVTFQGIGGLKVAKTNYANDGKVAIQYQNMNSHIQMNLQLLFEDYERTEAFMTEKFSDTTAMARTVVSGAVSDVTGKTHSVKPQVEGLIGALRNNYTRKIIFTWGKMQYTGNVTHVSAEYTMFSTDGNPIRAVVNLGIQCTEENMKDNNMGQWQKSYQEVFGKGDLTNLGSSTQNVGNLLNINL